MRGGDVAITFIILAWKHVSGKLQTVSRKETTALNKTAARVWSSMDNKGPDEQSGL